MSTLETVLIAYLFIGCIYWFWMAVGAVRVVRALPVLARLHPAEPETWPKVSVIIPACNEAEALEGAVATVRDQDYPDLEIILINDRSTDQTGAIIDRVAAADSRVRPLHITHLPDGWLGKVHALQCGVERASGQWLLFTDADVHLAGRPLDGKGSPSRSEGLLRRVVAYCEQRELDHLAAVPSIWSSKFILDVCIATFLRVLCIGMRCWAIEDPKSKAYIGVGAFNLVRRAALERTAGFEWLRLEVADDVGLGLMLKRSGARCCIVNATGSVGLYWYRSVAEMARGAEKGYASVASCSVLRLLAASGLMAALELAPLAAFIPVGHFGLIPAGVAMIAAAALSNILLARWANTSILPGLCFPLGVPLSVALLLRTGWLGFRRGGVAWRDTLYPSRILREGKRVKFP